MGDDSGSDEEAQGGPRPRPRLTALAMALALILALPVTATARGEAQPITLGQWMRVIFVTPDREIDSSQKGLAAAPPPLPVPAVVQTSSEPSAPRDQVARNQVPRLWFNRQRDRTRKRSRA